MNKLQFVPAECKIIRYEAADVINTSIPTDDFLEDASMETIPFNTLQ